MDRVLVLPSPTRADSPYRLANAYVLDGVCVVDPWKGCPLPSTVHLVSLTHTHGDHVSGLDELIKLLRLVDCPPGWELVSTPGHASTHRCFQRDGYLIAGDTIEGPGGAAPLVTATTGGDMLAHMTTTARLLDTEASIAFPGHGAPIHDPRAAYGRLLEYRLEEEAKIARLMLAGRQDDQIAAVLYPGHKLGPAIVAAHRAKILTDAITA